MQASWQDPPEYRGGGPQMAMPSLSPLVKRILIANVAVFGVCFVLSLINRGAWDGPLGIVNLFGIQPALWVNWFPFLPLWQLVTWGFLHSVFDPGHILFNMLGLYFFGTMLEGLLGSQRLGVLYGGALLIAGTATLLAGIFTGSSVPTLGASGAVLAVIVAAATLRPNAQVIFLIFPMRLWTLALIVVGMDVFHLLRQIGDGGAAGNVAYLAHVSGAAWGFLAVKQGWIWKDPVARLESWREERVEQRGAHDQAEVDRLLAKIHKEGIGSLSAREKAVLKRASKKQGPRF